MSEQFRKLSEPFPPEQVKHRRGPGGKDLDYVAIETVLQRLLEHAPDFSWSAHLVKHEGNLAIVQGNLTIDGKSATGMGAMANPDADMAVKSANSEAIKNAAKNGWGMALELWTEEGREVVARGRALAQGDVSALKQEVLRLGLEKGAEPNADAIAAKFEVKPEQLNDPDVLRSIIDKETASTQ
jgi:hypothetical protein